MISKPGVLLLLVAGLSLCCNQQSTSLPPTVKTTRNLDLKAGQYLTLSFTLNSGDLVEGTFAVLGPTNLDIKFAIQDPSGANVYGPTRSRSGSFTYRAQTTGHHSLFLDNSYSLTTGKIVTLTYTLPRR
jgi:hypothetical protein